MRRTKEDAAITREQLLKAAFEIFQERGYIATTLEDIARRAGTTRGAVYWHFGGKAELFNAMVREQYQRANIKLRAAYSGGGTPLQLLRRVLVMWIRYVEEDAEFRAMTELLMKQVGVHPEMEKGIQEKVEGTRISIRHFADLIRRAIDSGEVRPEVDPEIAAISAISLVYGSTSVWIFDPNLFSLSKGTAEEMVDLFIRGIAKP